jgi:hypothetical protein
MTKESSKKGGKKTISFDIDGDEMRKALKKTPPKITKQNTATKSSGLRSEMRKKGVPMKCAITGHADLAHLQSAHIYPECWINDGTFAMTPDELEKKFLIEKHRPLSLDAFLPRGEKNWKAQRKKLLEGIANRILLFMPVHTDFDGQAKRAPKLGRWSLVAKRNKKTKVVVPGAYEIVVKPAHVGSMKKIGVVDGATVNLPHVDPRLIRWHAASFTKYCPTAGAECRGGDDLSDDGDCLIHPEEVQGRADVQQQFVAEGQAMVHRREPIPEHVGLVRCTQNDSAEFPQLNTTSCCIQL